MVTRQTRIVANPTNLATRSRPTSVINALCKRTFDFILAVVALLIAAPVMMVIVLLLWLESPGAALFAQKRLAQHGRRFTLYKFRKFPVHWKSQGPSVTVANDCRLTRLGWVLERTKLDELPQLWNILKGDMSFVGPRPELPDFADLFVGRYRAVLDYSPGLFGPSSIRNECDLYPPDEDAEAYYRRVLFPWKAERDLAYYRKANLATDLIWIIKGVWESIVGAINWKGVIRFYGLMMVVDTLLVEIGWTFVTLFRYSGLPEGQDLDSFLAGLCIFPVLYLICAIGGQCYRYPKQHFSDADSFRLMISFSTAWVLGFLVLVWFQRNISFYLFPMGWCTLFLFLIFGRIAFRIRSQRSRSPQQQESPKVLIYGADGGGIGLAEWIRDSSLGITLLGFLDDDPQKRGHRVRGIRVLGREGDLPTIQSVHHIQEIWLAFVPDHKKRHRLNAFSDGHQIKLVVIPELEPFMRFSGCKR